MGSAPHFEDSSAEDLRAYQTKAAPASSEFFRFDSTTLTFAVDKSTPDLDLQPEPRLRIAGAPSSTLERAIEQGHNNDMTTPTREELDAKFERTEARVDARLADFQRTNSEALGEIRSELKAIHADLGHLKNLKWQLWGAVFAAVGLVYGLITYGAATYESGRNTATVVRDAQQKIEETSAAMKRQQEETQRVLQEALRVIGQQQPPKQ
jgi:hypothetical protein